MSTPTFCQEGLRLGQLQGNAFSIVLREARVMEAGGEQGGTWVFLLFDFDNDSFFDNDSCFKQKERKEEKEEKEEKKRRCGRWWRRR